MIFYISFTEYFSKAINGFGELTKSFYILFDVLLGHLNFNRVFLRSLLYVYRNFEIILKHGWVLK